MVALIRQEQTDPVIIVVLTLLTQRWVHLPFLRISHCFISGTSRIQNCKKRPISKNVCDGTYPVEYAQCLLASGHSSSARIVTIDVTTHRAPSLDGFRHFRFYCSNFAVKYLLITADILVITYS